MLFSIAIDHWFVANSLIALIFFHRSALLMLLLLFYDRWSMRSLTSICISLTRYKAFRANYNSINILNRNSSRNRFFPCIRHIESGRLMEMWCAALVVWFRITLVKRIDTQTLNSHTSREWERLLHVRTVYGLFTCKPNADMNKTLSEFQLFMEYLIHSKWKRAKYDVVNRRYFYRQLKFTLYMECVWPILISYFKHLRNNWNVKRVAQLWWTTIKCGELRCFCSKIFRLTWSSSYILSDKPTKL